jgi:integrase
VPYGRQRYGGLRRGELRALRVEDVDLGHGLIRVERNWDPREGEIDLKSSAGRRKVPISAVLRGFLVERLSSAEQAESDRFLAQQRLGPSTARS